MRAFIGLGSNLGDRAQHLRTAVRALEATPGIEVAQVSSIYETEPVGGPEQGDYLNAVVEISTWLGHRALFDACMTIEHALGRDRSTEDRWGPRAIDLDLLAMGDLVVSDPDLEIPHPRLAERAFVLVPFSEIAPFVSVPGLGKVHDLEERLLVTHTVRPAGSLA
ncbi:MAG: 2-amino-4-hydroxy-6-hydroxymethyldihydropteridine diphosphokinase [Actinomycetota bacterium]